MATILLDAFSKSDSLGKFVLAVLIVLSVYSWAVLISEYLSLRRSTRASHTFLRRFGAISKDPLALYGTPTCKQLGQAPLVRVYEVGCRRLDAFIRESRCEGTNNKLGTKAMLDVEDAMTMAIASESLEMETRLGSLATISSVSPLLGLFGTVWGIMLAFHNMGVTGTTSIRAVAPGLTVALVTTVSGLAVAIPALVGHNLLASQVRLAVSGMKSFSLDFLGLVEQASSKVERVD